MPDTDVDDNVPKIVPPVIYLDDDEDHINIKSNNTVNLEDSKQIKELNKQKINDSVGNNLYLPWDSGCLADFPGGEEALITFIKKETKYPDSARVKAIEGTVYISFIVTKSGDIDNVKVLRGIGGGCDEEAVRVIKFMPRWKPGNIAGLPVAVKMNIPIKFSLH